MAISLKPLEQQVIVITGASSGIGLATAAAAVRKGARVVLTARSANALEQIVARLNADGERAIAVTCDVAVREQVERVAKAAVDTFGRIDTWVNNAGVSIYGRVDETSVDDARRLFETNVLGVFNGSQVAIPHLKRQGGALINIGSEASEAAIPLQGVYSASKHAVKGLTDALRIELEDVDKANVSVTLIQPTAVNTPYPQHARNYMSEEAKLPTPMIEADQVADAILAAAVSHTRATKVGAMSKINTLTAKLIPPLGEKMASVQVDRQQYDQPPRNPQGALHQPSEAGGVVAQTVGAGGKEKE